MLNLVFSGHFVCWRKKLQSFIVNYHAKSGVSSLKIDRVMLNLVFVNIWFLAAILSFWRNNAEGLFLAAILFLVAILEKKIYCLRRVIMNVDGILGF